MKFARSLVALALCTLAFATANTQRGTTLRVRAGLAVHDIPLIAPEEADLAGVDLHGASLDGLDLSSVPFARLQPDGTMQGANLNGASLRGTDLRGASLQASDLRGTSMLDAVLSGGKAAVLIDNSQTDSAMARQLATRAAGSGVPAVEVTETAPASATSFVAWQVAQLDALAAALGL